MKQWPVIVVVAGTLASQEIKHQDADLHTHQETQNGPDQQIGRAAIERVQSDMYSTPFVVNFENIGAPVRRRDVRYDAGEQPIPFPLRFL